MRTEKIIDEAKNLILSLIKDNLQAIILYGGVSRGEYIEGVSDINILAIVKENPCSLCRVLWKEAKKINRLRLNIVLMTPEYIRASLDSFPLEFLDIKLSGKLLYGEQAFNELDIPLEPLRLQCERELKEKATLLRKIYISSAGKKEPLIFAISRSYSSLNVIVKGILFLKGFKEIPPDPIKHVSQEFNLDYKVFEKALAIKRKEIKPKPDELVEFFEHYVEEFERIQQAIDELKI